VGESIEDHARTLADAIDAALPGWVVRCVERTMTATPGGMTSEARRRAEAAGRDARAGTGSAIRALLEADIDEQRSTPLALLRQAVRYPTEVLRQAGVAPVGRDPFDRRSFPDDPYGLSPASLADVDPVLVGPGISWGAAKAFVHKQRHRSSKP
jgi:hypothetical protein